MPGLHTKRLRVLTVQKPTAFIVFLVIFISACQYNQIDNSIPVAPTGSVSYSSDIRPIFQDTCGGSACHISKTTSGVNLSDVSNIVTSVGRQYEREIVVRGDALSSPLVDKILPNPEFGQRMPIGRGSLSNKDVALIIEWIDSGAPDN